MAGYDEDRILVKEILEGRLQAFETLVLKYQKWVFYFVNRILRRQEDSDEITQKTFIQVFAHLRRFRFESSFKTWLAKIALNLSRNELRRKARAMVELNERITDAASEKVFEKSDEEAKKRWLTETLELLSATQKEVIVLRIYQELSFKEIAAVVGSSETAAKVNFHHGMKRLREILKKKKI